MYKSFRAGFLAIATILLSNIGAVATTGNDANTGIKLYLHGSYEAAMPYLERACSSGGSAQVHYYLADTYYRLGKTADALTEYKNSYKMDPHSNVSAYCQQVIRTLQTYNPGKSDISDPSSDGKKGTKTADASRRSGKVVLPTIPEAPTIVPFTEVRLWDYIKRVQFTAQAAEQVNKTNIHLKTVQELQQQARKLAVKALPAERAWGETANDWRARVAKGASKEADLVGPFDQAVTKAQALLADAKASESACKRARTGAEGPVPTTLVPYDAL